MRSQLILAVTAESLKLPSQIGLRFSQCRDYLTTFEPCLHYQEHWSRRRKRNIVEWVPFVFVELIVICEIVCYHERRLLSFSSIRQSLGIGWFAINCRGQTWCGCFEMSVCQAPTKPWNAGPWQQDPMVPVFDASSDAPVSIAVTSIQADG